MDKLGFQKITITQIQ